MKKLLLLLVFPMIFACEKLEVNSFRRDLSFADNRVLI